MSKYDELQAGYLASKNADIEHWIGLQDALRIFRKDFSAFLGIAEDARLTVDGREIPPIVLGFEIENVFKLVPYQDLPKYSYGYEFTVRVSFDAEKYASPRNFALINLHVAKSEGEFVFSERGAFAAKVFTGPDFSPLYEWLFQQLKQNY